MRLSTLLPGSFSVCALAAMLASCHGSQSIDDLNTRDVTLPSGKVIHAELATDPEMMARGLMFRDSLASDHGMLFLHQKQGRWQYFMFQCRIPLDIIWMDNAHKVVEVSANTPPCTSKVATNCPVYGGGADARYVLELGAGEAKRNAVAVGQEIAF